MTKKKKQLDQLITDSLQENLPRKDQQLLDDFTDHLSQNLSWDEALHGPKSRVERSIAEHIRQSIARPKVKKLAGARKYLRMGLAAGICTLIGLAFWTIKSYAKPELYHFETFAELDSLKLQDGSTIYLTPNSRINYDSNFNRKDRRIELLAGNAFFQVARNPEKPFIIQHGDLQTKVLGTSFNINLTDSSSCVTVYTGLVNVRSAEQTINLHPTDELHFSVRQQAMSVVQLAQENLTPWFKEDVTLRNQPLSIILDFIAKRYGLQAQLPEPDVLQTHATVYFAEDAPIETILEQINYITNIKLAKNGKTLTYVD